jgi:Rod binding domain-containing protein
MTTTDRVPPLAASTQRSNTASPLQASQHTFLSVLGRAANRTAGTPEAQARDAAQQFVSTTLVQPLLKQLREMENAAPPFAAGPGEKQFRALMDAEVAQNITSASHFPLIDRVARQLLKKAAKGAKPSQLPPQTPNPALTIPSLGVLRVADR